MHIYIYIYIYMYTHMYYHCLSCLSLLLLLCPQMAKSGGLPPHHFGGEPDPKRARYGGKAPDEDKTYKVHVL